MSNGTEDGRGLEKPHLLLVLLDLFIFFASGARVTEIVNTLIVQVQLFTSWILLTFDLLRNLVHNGAHALWLKNIHIRDKFPSFTKSLETFCNVSKFLADLNL